VFFDVFERIEEPKTLVDGHGKGVTASCRLANPVADGKMPSLLSADQLLQIGIARPS
jgi:hypothetical protein